MQAQVPTYRVIAAYDAVLFATALIALWLSLTEFLPRPAARSQANACHTEPRQRHLRADGSDSAAFARSTAE